MKYSSKVKGFTLIELIIVIAIIAILMAVVLVALNPAKRFADSRQATRKTDIQTIATAINKYVTDQALIGTNAAVSFAAGGTANLFIPTCASATVISASTLTALVPSEIGKIPSDPTATTSPSVRNYKVCYTPTNTGDTTGPVTVTTNTAVETNATDNSVPTTTQ